MGTRGNGHLLQSDKSSPKHPLIGPPLVAQKLSPSPLPSLIGPPCRRHRSSYCRLAPCLQANRGTEVLKQHRPPPTDTISTFSIPLLSAPKVPFQSMAMWWTATGLNNHRPHLNV